MGGVERTKLVCVAQLAGGDSLLHAKLAACVWWAVPRGEGTAKPTSWLKSLVGWKEWPLAESCQGCLGQGSTASTPSPCCWSQPPKQHFGAVISFNAGADLKNWPLQSQRNVFLSPAALPLDIFIAFWGAIKWTVSMYWVSWKSCHWLQ